MLVTNNWPAAIHAGSNPKKRAPFYEFMAGLRELLGSQFQKVEQLNQIEECISDEECIKQRPATQISKHPIVSQQVKVKIGRTAPPNATGVFTYVERPTSHLAKQPPFVHQQMPSVGWLVRPDSGFRGVQTTKFTNTPRQPTPSGHRKSL